MERRTLAGLGWRRRMSRNTLSRETLINITCKLCWWTKNYHPLENIPEICPACSGSPMKAYTKVDQARERE